MCSVPSSSFRLSPLGGIFCESAERGAAGNSTSAAASVAAAAELEGGGGGRAGGKRGDSLRRIVSPRGGTRVKPSNGKEKQCKKRFKNSGGNQSDGQKLSSYFKALDLRGRKK